MCHEIRLHDSSKICIFYTCWLEGSFFATSATKPLKGFLYFCVSCEPCFRMVFNNPARQSGERPFWGRMSLLSPPCPACGPLSPLHSGSWGCCGALSLPTPWGQPGVPSEGLWCNREAALCWSLTEPRQHTALCSRATCTADVFPEFKKKDLPIYRENSYNRRCFTGSGW